MFTPSLEGPCRAAPPLIHRSPTLRTSRKKVDADDVHSVLPKRWYDTWGGERSESVSGVSESARSDGQRLLVRQLAYRQRDSDVSHQCDRQSPLATPGISENPVYERGNPRGDA